MCPALQPMCSCFCRVGSVVYACLLALCHAVCRTSSIGCAQARFHKERAANRRNELLLDQLCAELETKAGDVQAQQVEYQRIKEAYGGVTAALEASQSDKRGLEVRLSRAAADASREAREKTCV